MSEFRLTRTGMAPLRIRGELVAESDGHISSGRECNRWHDLAVYQLDDGRYAVSMIYHTCWQGELERHTAVVAENARQVAFALEDYDPCQPVIGYPAGDAYRDRQTALLRDVRRRYESQVSEVLDSDVFALDAAEEEEADDGSIH
jgi:hypothetical protein